MPALKLSSSIGKKLLMAVTGLLMFGFVVGHLTGNLLIFVGQDALNTYAAKLKDMPALVWGARIGLLAIILVHIRTAVELTSANAAAAGSAGAVSHVNKATLMSRTMMISGVLLLAFIAFHLLHFTVGAIDADHHHLKEVVGGKERHHVYAMVYESFRDLQTGLLYTLLYVGAMVGLGFHLAHGLGSMLQTLGFDHKLLQRGAAAIAGALAIGYIMIPISVNTGLLPEPTGVKAKAADHKAAVENQR